jgi:ABC-type oligopeptide transport system substrate-binding subunit
MRRSKLIAIAILLFGSVAVGLTACEDRGKEQTKGTTGPSDAAKGPGSPANPQGPTGPGQTPGSPTEPGKSR